MTKRTEEFLDAMQERIDAYGADYHYPGWSDAVADMPKARSGDRAAVRRLAAFAGFAMDRDVASLGQAAIR